jgi:hypothetical protein
MSRGGNTAILAVLAAGLGAYIYFVDQYKTPAPETPPDAPLGKVFAAVDAAKISEIRITSSAGEATTVRKTGSAWRVVAPIDVAADETEVSGIASNLATAEVQRVIDEKPKDLAAYGLAKPKVTVVFSAAGDKTPHTLLIGDKNPTASDLYAKRPESPRVFLVSGYLEGTFDRSTFQLRDKALLAFDREKVDHIDVTAGKVTVTVARQADVWSVTAPWTARADFGVIESVLSRLAGAQMKAIAWDPAAPASASPSAGASAASGAKPGAPHSFKEFGLDPAERRLVLAAGSSRAELVLGKATPEGDVYARDASRPIVFTIEKTLADDLSRPPADFRSKDLFGFRAFTGTRLEIARAGKTVVFERKKGPEKDAVEKWAAVSPAKAVDEAKIEDLVTKVSNLRAESFVDALPAGATEQLRIQTAFDQGHKRETVVVHQAGGVSYAVRDGDAGAAKLIAPAITELVAALDATQK